MSAVTLPSEFRRIRPAPAASVPSPRLAAHGVGRVGFQRSGCAIRLADLYQSDPVRVLLPTPEQGDLPAAVLVTTSGGLVGGDRIDFEARVGKDAAALVAQQAAEKVYRSAGADCRIEVGLEVAADGWLEWLPQETILFEGARLRRRTRAEVASGGRLLAGEFLVLGRQARGENLTHGLVREDWEVRLDGRLAWADALALEDDIAALAAHPAGLDHARALATIVYAGPDASERRAIARDLLSAAPDGVRRGATLVGGVLVVRLLGPDPHAVRGAFGEFWAGFRQAAAGLPARMPRLWHI